MWFSSLPDNLMYSNVTSSTGKKPHVAPYSGAIFAIVALSGRERLANPAP